MKILVDGYWWHKGPPSGRAVLKEIVLAWAARFPMDQITLVVSGSVEGSDEQLPDNIVVKKSHLYFHPLINALELPIYAKVAGGFDVIFTQNFAALSRRSLVFIHDVIYMRHPEWFTWKERAYLGIISMLVSRRTSVVTSSVSEAEHISSSMVRVHSVKPVGLGINRAILSLPSSRPPAAKATSGFILAVGRLNVRKNLSITIDAAVQSGQISQDRPLFIVGSEDGRRGELSPAAQSAVGSGAVQFLGFLPDSELRWLYENCDLMVYLSLDEGFGMPPLEAAHFSAKILLSDIAVFREVVGDLATYVDPTRVDLIALQIKSMIEGIRPSVASVCDLQGHALPISYEWDSVVDELRAAGMSSIRNENTL